MAPPVSRFSLGSAGNEDSLKRMGKSGLTVREVVAPIPASFFADNFISFHMIAGVGLIEIISKNDSLKEA